MQSRDALTTNGPLAEALGERLGRPAFSSQSTWLSSETLDGLLRDLSGGSHATSRAGRQIGRSLVSPSRSGVALRRMGVGSPEKAYRRCDLLLAREREGDRYEVVSQKRGGARVLFYPADGRSPDPFFCRVREGMLAGLSAALGLPDARVRESRCAADGARCCEFEVHYRRSRLAGLAIGALSGAAAGAALLIFASMTRSGGGPAALLWLSSGLLVALGAAAGRAIDVGRRLRAYEAARAQAPDLLEQAERELAEKVDELARFDQALASAGAAPARSSGAASEGTVARETVSELHGSTAALQRSLIELRQRVVERRGGTPGEIDALIERSVAGVRDVHTIGARLAQSTGSAASREPHDLGATVERVVDDFRARAGSSLYVDLECAAELPPIAFEPYQIEVVVGQLLDNAAHATEGEGEIRVTLREEPAVLEIAVQDGGPGIDEELLDQVFDPFFEPPASHSGRMASNEPELSDDEAPEGDYGLGLSICYRIVKQHGGELRVESAAGQGATVTVALPKVLPEGDDT